MKRAARLLASLATIFLHVGLTTGAALAEAPEEMIIGEAVLPPGIKLIFEGAIKDDVEPGALHLAEAATA